MATEWFGPVVTAAVAAMGIGYTYKAGARQAETALIVSREQSESNLAAQREERLQRRLEAAYHELLVMLEETSRWVRAVSSMRSVDEGEVVRVPPMPQRADESKVEALIHAMWSPRVQQLMQPWGEAVTQLRLTAAVVASSDPHTQYFPQYEFLPVDPLVPVSNAVWKADTAIREQVWRELRGFHDGSAEASGGYDRTADSQPG